VTRLNNPHLTQVYSRPAWHDLGALTEVMDSTEVDLGLVIPSSSTIPALRAAGGAIHEATEAHNRSMSRDLEAASGRFVAMAVVDPFGGREDVAQLARSLKLPNIGGIGLTTNYGEITLDDKRFEPIFELAREYDVPVTVHPGGIWPGARQQLGLDTAFLSSGLGFFLVDGLCIFKMAGGGVFDRFPSVRFMFCQLGGVAPICCGRWSFHDVAQAHGAADHVPARSLADYLSHVWLDTHTQDRHALALVMAEFGAHTIVIGGDYPFTVPSLGMDYTLAELAALSPDAETRHNIECNNALALLGRRPD